MEAVHCGGKGPHWAVVPMKKKNYVEMLFYSLVRILNLRARNVFHCRFGKWNIELRNVFISVHVKVDAV